MGGIKKIHQIVIQLSFNCQIALFVMHAKERLAQKGTREC